jgi:hypothetical protein
MRRGWFPILSLVIAALPAAAEPYAEQRSAAELELGRLVFEEGRGIPGYRAWWAIDYPEAERHFIPGLERMTKLRVAADSVHVRATDERIYDHPLLLVQQPGKWQPSDAEARALREYLLRGGFVFFDDLHGLAEWEIFRKSMARILPGYPIVAIDPEDAVMNVVFELRMDTQIPGRRHLYRAADGSIRAYMEGPPAWRGIFDERGRLMAAINLNMDLGDAWQHADDPDYPAAMTALAYRFGVNYIVYALTH